MKTDDRETRTAEPGICEGLHGKLLFRRARGGPIIGSRAGAIGRIFTRRRGPSLRENRRIDPRNHLERVLV